jgi:hypothetical protein
VRGKERMGGEEGGREGSKGTRITRQIVISPVRRSPPAPAPSPGSRIFHDLLALGRRSLVSITYDA